MSHTCSNVALHIVNPEARIEQSHYDFIQLTPGIKSTTVKS